jgi:hypothetical protein
VPRDLSGTYSRIIPPGASGYQPSTTISSAQINAEINDIGAELTKSIDKTGATSPTNNLPMANFVHSGLGLADAAGETLRYEALGKGSDIAVIANGAVALPLEGALFNLTGASAFNVTGFTGRHDGRPFSVRFAPDKLLTLVNGANFKLLGGYNRITRAGEIINFIQESSGVITETGLQPIISMTGYSGADISLGIGQVAIYDLSAIASLALRIATGDSQQYEIDALFTTASAGASVSQTIFQPNNIGQTGIYLSNINITQSGVGTSVVSASNQANVNTFVMGAGGGREYRYRASMTTKLATKTVFAEFFQNAAAGVVHGSSYQAWLNQATAWSSLGTITHAEAKTGRIQVRRVA